MPKQWYKVTLFAKMDDDDIKAMNKCFCQALDESMNIRRSALESIVPTDSQEDDDDICADNCDDDCTSCLVECEFRTAQYCGAI